MTTMERSYLARASLSIRVARVGGRRPSQYRCTWVAKMRASLVLFLIKDLILFKVMIKVIILVTCTRISAWQRASSPGAEPPLSLQLAGGNTLWSMENEESRKANERAIKWRKMAIKVVVSELVTFQEERRSRAEWGRGGRGRCWSQPPVIIIVRIVRKIMIMVFMNMMIWQ